MVSNFFWLLCGLFDSSKKFLGPIEGPPTYTNGEDCCGDNIDTSYCSICECLDPNYTNRTTPTTTTTRTTTTTPTTYDRIC